MKLTKEWLNLKNFRLVLSVVVIIYLVRVLLLFCSGGTGNFFLNDVYFFGAKIFPLWLFTMYLFSPMQRKWHTFLFWVVIYFIAVSVIYCLNGFFRGYTFLEWTGLKWSYHAMITWSISVLSGMILWFIRIQKRLESFVLSFLSSCVAGFLYEVPLYPLMGGWQPIHIWHPLIVSTALLSPFMVYYLLCKLHWKITKPFIFALSIYVAFSVTYPFTVGLWMNWVPRLPATILMLSIPLTYKEMR